MAAIETDRLTRRFGDVLAVEDLTLSVESGEVFGFLGPNGAGKSTTIDVLLGFTRPTAGSATVLGHDATTESRAVRRRTGLLPEGFAAVKNLTGREHVEAAIETKGADDDPDEIVERVGLDPDDARRPADEYSKGMHRRLGLGIALVGDPDLLILDEPSSGLDPNGVRLVREIVREERDRGATVFFSSHVLDEVERVCDRVAILQDGELSAVNSVENLRADLGMGSVVEATVDAPPDSLDLSDVDGVTDVAIDAPTVRVACASPGAKMPALRRIDRAVTVEDVTIEEASLESLFEKYTDGESPDVATTENDATAKNDPTVATDGGDPR